MSDSLPGCMGRAWRVPAHKGHSSVHMFTTAGHVSRFPDGLPKAGRPQAAKFSSDVTPAASEESGGQRTLGYPEAHASCDLAFHTGAQSWLSFHSRGAGPLVTMQLFTREGERAFSTGS